MRRFYAPVVLGLLALGGLAWFSSSRVWATAEVEVAGVRNDIVEATGGDLVPVVGPLALVICAAALGILAAGYRLRQVIGFIVILAGLGALAAIVLADTQASVVSLVETSPAFLGGEPDDASLTAWPVTAVLLLVSAAGAGVITVLGASSWPTMSSRYDAPQAPKSDDSDPWKQLDAGEDPTTNDEES